MADRREKLPRRSGRGRPRSPEADGGRPGALPAEPEPALAALEAWLAGVREAADPDFPDRDQPPMPPPRDIFD
jgi:hypothetical protein